MSSILKRPSFFCTYDIKLMLQFFSGKQEDNVKYVVFIEDNLTSTDNDKRDLQATGDLYFTDGPIYKVFPTFLIT